MTTAGRPIRRWGLERMTDIRTTWSASLSGDWLLDGDALDSSRDLETAVILSLFTDRRAGSSDALPDGSGDRRGWWGDATSPGYPMGSRLWLLAREKITPALRLRVIDYVREALAWMVSDGLADRVTVDAEYAPGTPTRLDVRVTIDRAGVEVFARRFDPFWQEITQ